MIKAICMDLDGTLLNSEKEISKQTREGLIQYQESGVKVILASGRTKKRMGDYADELQLEKFGGAIIESNGSAVYDYSDDTAHEIRRLTHEEAEEIFQFLKVENTEILVMCVEDFYIYLPEGQKESAYLKASNMEGLRNRKLFYFHTIDEIKEPINKVCIVESSDRINEVYNRLSTLKDSYWYGRVLPTWLEVGPLDATKGNALQLIADKHHIDINEIVAFGDGENDLSMLKLMKYSVAMDNALNSVKSVCNYVCDNCDEDGIIKFLNNMEVTK